MQTILTIDTRERDLIARLDHHIATNKAFADITYTPKQLPLADVIISTDDRPNVIIERKAIADLFASIKDGRYDEQSCRLSGTAEWPNHNILYLIEGLTPRGDQLAAFHSALFSLNFYKGFSVVRTYSIDETAFFILNTVRRIERNNKNKKYPIWGATVAPSLIDTDELAPAPEPDPYANAIKKVKKDNVTPQNIGQIMLSTIPGVSVAIAAVIMAKYGTLANLITTLQTAGPDDMKGLKDSNGRKISKTALSNIYNYMVSSSSEVVSSSSS